MPQLDKFSFLDQIISVIVSLFIIYIFNVYVFLPKLIFVLKLRHRFLKKLKIRQEKLNLILIFLKKENIHFLNFSISNFFFFYKFFIENYKDYLYILKYTTYKYINRSDFF